MPGERPLFYMEIPPLRWPKSQMFCQRLHKGGVVFQGDTSPLYPRKHPDMGWKDHRAFDLVINILSYPVSWIGLPKEAATAFLLVSSEGTFELQGFMI